MKIFSLSILMLSSCVWISCRKDAGDYSSTVFLFPPSVHKYYHVESGSDSSIVVIKIENKVLIDGLEHHEFTFEFIPHQSEHGNWDLYRAGALTKSEGFVRWADSAYYFLNKNYELFRGPESTEYLRACCSREQIWLDVGIPSGEPWEFRGPFPFPQGRLWFERFAEKDGKTIHALHGVNSEGIPHSTFIRTMWIAPGKGVYRFELFNPMLARSVEFNLLE